VRGIAARDPAAAIDLNGLDERSADHVPEIATGAIDRDPRWFISSGTVVVPDFGETSSNSFTPSAPEGAALQSDGKILEAYTGAQCAAGSAGSATGIVVPGSIAFPTLSLFH
jgi:hypothetical protein